MGPGAGNDQNSLDSTCAGCPGGKPSGVGGPLPEIGSKWGWSQPKERPSLSAGSLQNRGIIHGTFDKTGTSFDKGSGFFGVAADEGKFGVSIQKKTTEGPADVPVGGIEDHLHGFFSR
jgi:hypothetical protein